MRRSRRKNTRLSVETAIIIAEEKAETRLSRNGVRHRKELIIQQGFDALENLCLVRFYMQRKYNINYVDFELLLYLYPIGYFNMRDYENFPMRWGYSRFNQLIEKNMIKKVFPDRKTEIIYALTVRGKRMVRDAHDYLFEHKPIPLKNNPILNKNPNYMEQRHKQAMLDFHKKVKHRLKKDK